jgi:IS30 family transposase
MSCPQITLAERYRIAALRGQGVSPAAIARDLGRHRSTIGRELRRNRTRRGRYEAYPAHTRAFARRSYSRCHQRVTAAAWRRVVQLLAERWSPEQIAGWGRETGELTISHETIYRYLWADRLAGGELSRLLRHGGRRRRRWRGSPRGRGPLGRSIRERPASVATRRRVGHWEVDTVLGGTGAACIVSLVERKTGYVVIGKLPARTAAAFARRTIGLIRAQRRAVRTITADNGSELTGYRLIEQRTGTRFYFANPYHAWERGTNENTNGLIREFLPKGQSMARLTQRDCTRFARQLNRRPRKRLGFRTPEDCYAG